MMNLNKFAFAGAIALAGAMGFTACSSDDDITSGQNPTFDGETVKTQFSISVPATSAPGSRLSEDIVQGQSPAVFRGLQNMRLIPIDMNTHPNAEGSITLATTDVPNGNVIVLPAIGASDDATDFSGQNATKGNYKVYNDIEIPVNTDAFVFYGEATPTTGNTDLEINQKNGALDPSYVSTGWTTTSPVDQITFSLRQIAPGGSSAVSSDTQALLAVLNGIAGTTGWSSITDAPDGDALLYRLYKTFTLQEVSDGTTYAPTSAAGSSENIRLMAQNLYNTIKEANYTEEGTAKTVADAIITSIETYFTKTGDNVPYTLAWKDSYSAYNTASFPGNYGLPDDIATYTHRSGRTGRAGKTGVSVAIIHSREKSKLRAIEKKIGKTFEHEKVPTPQYIIEKQLYNLADRIEKVKVNETEIEKYLPGIVRKLEWLSESDLLKRVVSLEFNRLLDYYKDAPSVVDYEDKNPKSKKDRKGRDRGGDKASRRHDSEKDKDSRKAERGYERIYVNAGKADGFFPARLIDTINQNMSGRVDIGRIDLLNNYSLFDVRKGDGHKVVSALKNVRYFGKRLYAELADPNRDYSKLSDRKSKGKRTEDDEPFAKFKKGKSKKRK